MRKDKVKCKKQEGQCKNDKTYIMKKHVLIALIALMSCMTAVGQDIRKGSTSLVVIEKEWEHETLSGVENNTLGAMLDCFDKR